MVRYLWLGCALGLALGAAFFLPVQLLPVQHVLDDWRTRLAVTARTEARIVIIDVDERSLARTDLGVWPWPRPTIARLLQTLMDDYQVASIAVDMVFPDPRPDEDALRFQFGRAQVTGAVIYDLGQRGLPALRLPLPAPPPLLAPAGAPLVNANPVMANHGGLIAARVGHITPVFDLDGALRRLPPLLCSAGRDCRPVLGLAAFAGLLEQPRLQLTPGQGWLAPPWELKLGLGEGTIVARLPLNAAGELVVPYRHGSDAWIRSISAVDILENKADPALLKGVMVLMGGTALGMGDVIATPMNPLAAGMAPHAEILAALLDNDFPYQPQWGVAMSGALLLPFALLLGWAAGRYRKPGQRALLVPVWLLLTWLGAGGLTLWALTEYRLLLPLLPLLLFPPLAVLVTLLAELHRSGSEHAGVLSLLSAYLPRPVAARLASFSHRGAVVNGALDATRREITVLFADIHGFAGITEDRPPELVARLMQRVFSDMAEAVVQHHGTIDKFIGDAIMAFWNAPDDDPQHATHALAAAYDILRRMEALAPFCRELGIAPIQIGIGIETGHALVGNFGSAHRRTFTALGEPVVLASRLEGLTTLYDQPMLIGPGCAQALGTQGMRELRTVQIRGRVHPLTLYIPT